MVLESLLSVEKARRNSWSLFFIGILYSTIAIVLSVAVFPYEADISSIFLTAFAVSPLFVKLMKDEENLTMTLDGKAVPIFKNHLDVVSIFFFLFLGFAVSFSFWFTFLPSSSANLLFAEQIRNFNAIKSLVSGNMAFSSDFLMVLRNNLRVFFFFFLFSLIYGAGAVIILCWNASVLGTAVGVFMRSKIGAAAGIGSVATYLIHLPYGFGQYMLHGSVEIVAYILASLAGGILSASLVRKDYKSKRFLKIIKDATILLFAGVILLVAAAGIEVGA